MTFSEIHDLEVFAGMPLHEIAASEQPVFSDGCGHGIWFAGVSSDTIEDEDGCDLTTLTYWFRYTKNSLILVSFEIESLRLVGRQKP